MISGNRMRLSSILSVMAKAGNTYVHVIFFIFTPPIFCCFNCILFLFFNLFYFIPPFVSSFLSCNIPVLRNSPFNNWRLPWHNHFQTAFGLNSVNCICPTFRHIYHYYIHGVNGNDLKQGSKKTAQQPTIDIQVRLQINVDFYKILYVI